MSAWATPVRSFLAVAIAFAASTSVIAAPVPMVTNGHLVGVAGFSDSGCAEENCGPYVEVGTIVSVDRQPKTDLPTGFRLRGVHGEHHELIDADWQGASMLDVRRIRKYLIPGRVVMVIGKRTGEAQVPVPSEVMSIDFAQKLIDADQAQTKQRP